MSQRREIFGGLKIDNLRRITPNDYDPHWSLLKNNFDLKKFGNLSADQFQELEETVDSLNNDPITIGQYIQKFKNMNLIHLAHEENVYMNIYDGPYELCFVEDYGPKATYEVNVKQKFLDRIDGKLRGNVVVVPETQKHIFKEAKEQELDYETGLLRFTLISNEYLPTGEKYYVRYKPVQFLFKAKKFVLENARLVEEKLGFLVFPKKDFIDSNQISKDVYLQKRNQTLQSSRIIKNHFNGEQKEAIYAIVNGSKNAARNSNGDLLPYLIRGPPGTGKTDTIVEALRIMIKRKQPILILLAYPTNDAANKVALQLLQEGLTKDHLFRLYSNSTDADDLYNQDPRLLEITYTEGKAIGIPKIEDLRKFKVILTTIGSSTYLVLGQMSGMFTHIIIDEAGQSSELESIIPIVGLSGKDTKIVLAGDSQQLGPIETVQYLRDRNLTISMMERFEKIKDYSDDPRLSVFLRQNYRSHAAIVELLSEMFYGNKLVKAPNSLPRDSLLKWNLLPNKKFPFLWHHLESQERRHPKGSSFANDEEVKKVCVYVKSIVEDLRVSQQDITVVTPYTYQLNEIEEALWKKCLNDVKATTAERIQGAQSKVVIVSTVRSNQYEKLGFLNSEKRFNTVISRASELVVIVGNASVMKADSSWARLIDYCCTNDATIDMPDEIIKAAVEASQVKEGNSNQMTIETAAMDKQAEHGNGEEFDNNGW